MVVGLRKLLKVTFEPNYKGLYLKAVGDVINVKGLAQKLNNFTLKELIDMDVMTHEETITNISTQACQEQILFDEMALQTTQWDSMQLESKQYKLEEGHYTQMYILKGIKDL